MRPSGRYLAGERSELRRLGGTLCAMHVRVSQRRRCGKIQALSALKVIAQKSLDSCNENLSETGIHRNCAGGPGGIAAPGFLLRGRTPAAARGAHFLANRKDDVMPFEKGESGNPAGRPRGARNQATLLMQNLLADDAEAIGRKAIEMAKGGDLTAIRLCMDRLAPARKDEPVAFELPPIEKPADIVAATASIVAAVAAGELTPSQAAELSKVIDVHVRALESKDFDERLTKLENQKVENRPGL
jgi:hypothetical protein